MKALLLCGCLCLGASTSFAHRLDEYLQAARISVATNRIEFTFELTPGVAVVTNVMARMDSDRDGVISTDEQTAYARQFLKNLSTELDGKPMVLSVTSVSFPGVEKIQDGTGVIRIRAASPRIALGPGEHVLHLVNKHLPGISVYLVNALQSKDPAVEIGAQRRDESQKDYRLEFRIR